MSNFPQIDSSRTQLGNSDLIVSRIGLGSWPMAGITSLGVEDSLSVATIRCAIENGVNFIDSAYSYGYDGRSDRIIAEAIRGGRDQVVLASKVGQELLPSRSMIKDARPGTLLTQAAKTLERLGIEQIDLLYLHAPDPNVPIEESAEAMAEICRRGWARYAGVCNVDLPQLQRFVSVCPVIAVQTYFNMFQQDSVHLLQGFCSTKDIAIVGYWILMKGMLAGQMARDHTFEPSDRRLTYPIYQGERWKKAQDLLDALRPIARQCDLSVAQLVIAWALAQPGLSVALVGAKRPEQIQETANSMRRTIPVETLNTIDGLLANP